MLFPLDDLSGDEKRELAAYHEAGHAVSAWCLDLGVGDVKIRQEGGGHFIPLKTIDVIKSEFGELDGQRRGAMHWLSGIHAQQRFRHNVFPDGCNDDSASADSAIRAMADLADNGDYDDLVEQIRQETKSLVNEHWTRIVALATALMETPLISGPEAAYIIEKATPQK